MFDLNSITHDGGRLRETPRRRKCLGGVLAVVLAGLVLAACSYRGAVDTPATLKFTWFSYLNGDDIREGCVAGSPPRYRLVYNADYDRQVRSYELTGDGHGGAFLTARVISGSGIPVSDVALRDIAGIGGWTRAEAILGQPDLQALEDALDRSGAREAAPVGLRLYSNDSYWVASLCRDGRYLFNAWLYPSPRYDRLVFPDRLFAHDRTGVPVAPPRKGDLARRLKGSTRDQKPNFIFQLVVGERGFRGLAGI